MKDSDKSIDYWSLIKRCGEYSIENYSIENGLLNVDGDVYLNGYNLRELPLNFGKITGHFDCSLNKLTSLKGAPSRVGGDFKCYTNKLKSLKGAPSKVDGNFDCGENILTSLAGAPSEVGGNFDCSLNQLTSLNGAPSEVDGSFICSFNPDLNTLNGSPKYITNLDCGNTPIHKWWNEIDDVSKLPLFLKAGIDANEIDQDNLIKINQYFRK
jgi:hypothetical protein